MIQKNDYEIEIAMTVDQVASLRDGWEKMNHHPNTDIDVFLSQLLISKRVISPYVVTVKKNGQPKTIFVGRIELTSLDYKIGYLNVFSPKARVIHFSYGGILGDSSLNSCDILLQSIKVALENKYTDIVHINHLPIDTNLFQIMKDHSRIENYHFTTIPNVHWQMSVPESFDDLFRRLNSKFRKNLRRSMKKMEQSYNNKIRLKLYRTEEEIQEYFRYVEIIASKSYQRGLGVGFIDDELTRRITEVAAKKGWFRGYILYLDGVPVSFERTFQYGSTLYCYDAAYDPKYKNVDPGTNLFMHIIEDLLMDHCVDYIDFGFGDAFYKQQFCDEKRHESSIYLYGPTVKGQIHRKIRQATDNTKHIIGKMVQLNTYIGIKRMWRNMKTKHTSQNENK